MHTLGDLKKFFENKGVNVKNIDGWQLKIGKDIWTMAHGHYYCNSVPTDYKDIKLLRTYKRSKT